MCGVTEILSRLYNIDASRKVELPTEKHFQSAKQTI